MKTKTLAALLLCVLALIPSGLRAQTNNLTALLQQGLFEEQANRNLDAAIADYQALARQFDKDRQLAATAVFRLGECYRMQNKTNEAAARIPAHSPRFLRPDHARHVEPAESDRHGNVADAGGFVGVADAKGFAGETNCARRTRFG